MTEQQDKVRDVLSKMQGRFGSESMNTLSHTPNQDVQTYSTGSIGLDHATGIGGIPRGRIVEIFGGFSSGKTTICMHAIKDCQAQGGTAAFIDVEQSYNGGYSTAIGIDNDALIFSQPGSGEEALQMTLELCQTGAVDLVVIDSVSALVPMAEIAGEISDSHVGLHARMMGQALRKITPTAKQNNVLVIFINQLRMNIGQTFGDNRVTSGGKALSFFASMRLDISKIGKDVDKSTGEVMANKTRVKLFKNKMAPPFTQAEFLIEYGVGISQIDEVMDYGVKLGLIHQGGSWFTYGEEKYQGKHNLAAYLTAHPEELHSLTEQVVLGLSELK